MKINLLALILLLLQVFSLWLFERILLCTSIKTEFGPANWLFKLRNLLEKIKSAIRTGFLCFSECDCLQKTSIIGMKKTGHLLILSEYGLSQFVYESCRKKTCLRAF